jgi:hypothetical protein
VSETEGVLLPATEMPGGSTSDEKILNNMCHIACHISMSLLAELQMDKQGSPWRSSNDEEQGRGKP